MVRFSADSVAETRASRDSDNQVNGSNAMAKGYSAPVVSKGDIVWAELTGAAADGMRPVLVVQNDTGNRFGATVIVSPLTSNLSSKAYPTNVILPSGLLPKPAEARLSLLMTIDKSRLGARIGRLPLETMAEVDRALSVSLGLREIV